MTSIPIKEVSQEKKDCEAKAPHTGERILIIQSAEPVYILKALERLEDHPQFHNPSYSIFCRNRPEALRSFQNHAMLDQVFIHTETRDSWKHLRNLRRQKFTAMVLLMTGDPGYWKIKAFAPLLGIPLKHILIFNENIDCFFFNWSQWLGLVSYRMRERPNARIGIRHVHHRHFAVSLITKAVIFPFRFLWLLLVWARLRLSGIKSSRKSHDYSLPLPPFPGA